MGHPEELTIRRALAWLWHNTFSRRRRVQGYLVAIYMLVGGLAELVTIGAIIPLLAVFASPTGLSSKSRLGALLGQFGIQPGSYSLGSTAAIFCAVAVGAAVVRITLAWLSQKYVFRIGHDIGVTLYERMLHQPYSFHIRINSSRILSSVENIQTLLKQTFIPLMQAMTAMTIGLFIVAALVVISPMISGVALVGFGSIYLLMSVLIRPRLRRNSVIIKETNRSRIQAVQEGLGGIREVLIENAQKVYLRKFAKIDNKLRHAQGANALFAIAPKFIAEAAGMVLLVVLVVLASKEPGGISHSLPVVGALALGAQRLLPLLQQLYNGWANLLGNSAMLFGVVELLRKPMPSRFTGERKEVPPLRRTLELRAVSFRYSPELALALDGVDVIIPRGARVGIVGPSGSGKTTLMDLTMGLLQPTDGSILVDGTPLDESYIVSWQKQIAHVPQHIFLLDGSIAENVAFGCVPSDIDRSGVHEACRLAQLDEFVSTLPSGYDSFVGERGIRLSGGQRQRIGIARALYRKASVLVLDEATSALDDSTEANVIEAVERLGDEYTILMIAHRVTTLRGCDMICRLDSGRISETGTYVEVLGDPDTHRRAFGRSARMARPSA